MHFQTGARGEYSGGADTNLRRSQACGKRSRSYLQLALAQDERRLRRRARGGRPLSPANARVGADGMSVVSARATAKRLGCVRSRLACVSVSGRSDHAARARERGTALLEEAVQRSRPGIIAERLQANVGWLAQAALATAAAWVLAQGIFGHERPIFAPVAALIGARSPAAAGPPATRGRRR
jgi:hypothetical protein